MLEKKAPSSSQRVNEADRRRKPSPKQDVMYAAIMLSTYRKRIRQKIRRLHWLKPAVLFIRSLRLARYGPIPDRLRLASKIAPISWAHLDQKSMAHNDSQLYKFINEVLARNGVHGVLVEAGAFRGVGTAKLSHLASMTGRRLICFDSFAGLPDNEEPHEQSIMGHSIEGWFEGGKYAGTLADVQATVDRYGCPEVVEYVEGWFDQTMPKFTEPVAAAYLDCDLASSTRTCLQYLWPLVEPGGVIVSQDGDFPLVIEVFDDDKFWNETLGCVKPEMTGLGSAKMVTVYKPSGHAHGSN